MPKKIIVFVLTLFFALPLFASDEEMVAFFDFEVGLYKDKTLYVGLIDLNLTSTGNDAYDDYLPFGMGFCFFPCTYNFDRKITELGLVKLKIGMELFDTDYFILGNNRYYADDWRVYRGRGNVRFFVPLFVEFNLINSVFDAEHYWVNPEINIVAKANLIVAGSWNFGFGVREKLSIRNAIMLAVDKAKGTDKINHGLRGEIAPFRFNFFVSFRYVYFD